MTCKSRLEQKVTINSEALNLLEEEPANGDLVQQLNLIWALKSQKLVTEQEFSHSSQTGNVINKDLVKQTIVTDGGIPEPTVL